MSINHVPIVVVLILLSFHCRLTWQNHLENCLVPLRSNAIFLDDRTGEEIQPLSIVSIGASVTMICDDGFTGLQDMNSVCQPGSFWRPGVGVCRGSSNTISNSLGSGSSTQPCTCPSIATMMKSVSDNAQMRIEHPLVPVVDDMIRPNPADLQCLSNIPPEEQGK